MGVMIHLGYKVPGGGGPPSPVDGKDPDQEWPLDEWAKLLPLLASYGVTVALTPPLTKGASLGAGYDPFDHYDLGSKVQTGRLETRYGSIETSMRFFAQARALGMQVYVNVVQHHLNGDPGNYKFEYLGADGKTKNGRFPKDKHCFTQVWPHPEGVPDSSTDWAFGREFMWNTGWYGDGKGPNGPGYVSRNLIESLDWQTRRLGAEGYFIDDTKGTNAAFVARLLNSKSMRDKVAFGEYSDGQTQNQMRWMHGPDINRRCGCMDFPLKYKLTNVLNNPGRADMRQILREGVVWNDAANSVTFLDNQDSDLTTPVVRSKLLGYAMLLTFPGYPMLFLKDLYERYGAHRPLLKPVLNLVWIHESLAHGEHVWRSVEYNHLVYERMGDGASGGLIAGINNEPGSLSKPEDWRPVRTRTKWRNTRLHDYTGHSNDQWTDNDGMVTLWLPPNDDGRGYVVFAPLGADDPVRLRPRDTVQTFFGADDLDTPAARNGRTKLNSILAAKGSALAASVHVTEFAGTGAPNAKMRPGFLDEDGTAVTGTAPREGWYTPFVESSGLPDEGVPFEMRVGYRAPALPIAH